MDGVGLDDIERLVESAGAFESLRRLAVVSRENVDDLLDRFRDRGAEVIFRRSSYHFDPWDEETEIPPDTLDVFDETTGTIYLDYISR